MHTLTLVIAPSQSEAEYVLEPFDENNEVDPYVDATKIEWLSEERELLQYRLKHIDNAQDGAKIQQLLDMNDDDLAQHVIDRGDDMYDAEGNRLSTVNPYGAYDYYIFGGRWADEYRELQGVTVGEYWKVLEQSTDLFVGAMLADDDWHDPVSVDEVLGALKNAEADSDNEQRVWFYDCHD